RAWPHRSRASGTLLHRFRPRRQELGTVRERATHQARRAKENRMKHFFFHLMPYPKLPADFSQKHESAWVCAPNELFDPQVMHRVYNDYIEQLAAAEDIGFDGVCVNEHHQNAYGLMPSPNIIASMLCMRTKRIRIAVVGNALPLYNPPTRVAEEIAMLDCIS